MAEIIETKYIQIETNKGVIEAPVFYIDEDIIAGASTGFRVPQTPIPLTVFVSTDANNTDIFTEFESNDGNIKGYVSGSAYYIDLLVNGSVVESVRYQPGTPQANHCGMLSYLFFIGTNGVASIASILDVESSLGSATYPARFNPNTTDDFGSYYREGAVSSGGVSFNANTIRNAQILLGAGHIESDPYSRGNISGTGGGTGTFSGTGDAISIPSLPTLSATSAGFITLFNPSAGQMAQLAAYMWTGAFDLDTFKKIFANPMDCILGLSIVPVDVPAGAAAVVKVGNISTGISMTTAASQYVEVDCGTLNVEEFWGAYLDYDPYTKAEIYLPYIGTHPIAVDDIMGKSVHVVYHVDILSGACIAYIQCGGTVLYSFIGQCSSSIPITGNDWTNVVNGVLSIAGSIGSMVATGGASAPAAVGNIMSTAVNQMKPSVEKSGSLSGTGGMMGVQTPYLILTRPRQALPKSQNAYTGYPSFIHEDLGTLSGYTEVEEIHLENVPATDGEISEIVSLLKGGVIF